MCSIDKGMGRDKIKTNKVLTEADLSRLDSENISFYGEDILFVSGVQQEIADIGVRKFVLEKAVARQVHIREHEFETNTMIL